MGKCLFGETGVGKGMEGFQNWAGKSYGHRHCFVCVYLRRKLRPRFTSVWQRATMVDGILRQFPLVLPCSFVPSLCCRKNAMRLGTSGLVLGVGETRGNVGAHARSGSGIHNFLVGGRRKIGAQDNEGKGDRYFTQRQQGPCCGALRVEGEFLSETLPGCVSKFL